MANHDTLRFRCRAACFGVSKTRRRGRPIGRRRPLGLEVLGEHWRLSLVGTGLLPAQLPNSSATAFQLGDRSGWSHRQNHLRPRKVLSMILVEARFASLQAFAASLGAWRAHPPIEKLQAPERRREASHPPADPGPCPGAADPGCAGDLQQKRRKLIMPVLPGSPAFPHRLLQVASATRQA